MSVGPPSRWRLRDLPWLLAAVTLAATADLIERLRRRRTDPTCKTCANSGWVGSRSDPKDCPTCGRKPYWLVGDGTYPSPALHRKDRLP